MRNHIPQLDMHNEATLGSNAARLQSDAVVAFYDRHIDEFEKYRDKEGKNFQRVLNQLNVWHCPPTLANLYISFKHLEANGELVQRHMQRETAQAFANDPEWKAYQSRENGEKLLNFMAQRGMDFEDIHSYRVAFHQLVATKQIRPVTLGTVRARPMNMAEEQLAAEEKAKVEALLPAGQPVKKGSPLHRAYVESRNRHRQGNHDDQDYNRRMTAARAQVGLAHPDVPSHSKEFARLVAEAVRAEPE